MINSFYTSSVGLKQTQNKMGVISNNIANISTVGYKASKGEFSDLLYTNIRETDGVQVGHGSKLQKTDVVHTAGTYKTTNRPLDFAIMSDRGFFAVQTGDGVKFTRAGNFALSQAQNGNLYLTDPQGALVLDSAGQPIVMENENDIPNIGVFDFNNSDGLIKDGNNCFLETANSGAAFNIAGVEVRSNTLEGSSVNLAEEMTDIIITQRAFQFNSRLIQLSDEIMQTVNSLR